MNKLIFIPAYKPDERLTDICSRLSGAYHVLVVDDGSGSEFDPVFQATEEFATVLRYEKNRGKGGALKYGYSKIKELFPDVEYVITADADGQHTPEDIAKVAEKVESDGGLVLGSREFTGKVPARSAFGNSLTKFVFKIASGVWVRDTQTGLRAFGVEYLDEYASLKGDRYEYEMTQLMYAAQKKIPISEVGIETIYENNNETSHFHPIRDSIKIYWIIYINSSFLKFCTSSIIAFLVDYLISFILKSCVFTSEHLFEKPEFIKNLLTGASVATALSWIISSFLNFNLNKLWSFKSNEKYFKALIGYYSLAVLSMLFKSFVLLSALVYLSDRLYLNIILSDKLLFSIQYFIAGTLMVLINYFIQKKFVFKKKDTPEKDRRKEQLSGRA